MGYWVGVGVVVRIRVRVNPPSRAPAHDGEQQMLETLRDPLALDVSK